MKTLIQAPPIEFSQWPRKNRSTGISKKLVTELALARINHQLRRETQREAGWSKAGAGLWKGCMRTYRPHRNPSPTPLQPASRKSQQMAGDFSGLAGLTFFGLLFGFLLAAGGLAAVTFLIANDKNIEGLAMFVLVLASLVGTAVYRHNAARRVDPAEDSKES